MKKILLGIAILLLVASGSYCQESKQPLQRFDKSGSINSPSREDSKGSPLELTIKSDKEVYEAGESVITIIITYTIENISPKPIVFFDRNFIRAELDNGQRLMIYPDYRIHKEFMIRSDWREGKSEYVTIQPHDKITHTYHYILQQAEDFNLPQKVNIEYSVTRKKSDNFYYDFEKEGMRATTKIPIDAWTGTLTSNTITIEVREKKLDSKIKLNEDQARELASKLAEEAFGKERLLAADGRVVKNAKFPSKAWWIEKKEGRWILGIHPPSGKQADVSFNLDGSHPKVKVDFALQ